MMRYSHIKKKMMADPDEYSNGRIHVQGMSTWRLIDKVEELEEGLNDALSRITQLERQVMGLAVKKKGG